MEKIQDWYWIDRKLFDMAPNSATWASLLQPTAISVLSCLTCHANNKTRLAWPSYTTMAMQCGVSRKSAIKSVKKLLTFCMLTREGMSDVRTCVFHIENVEMWKLPKAARTRLTRADKGLPRNIQIQNVNNSDGEYQSLSKDDRWGISVPQIGNNIPPDRECYSPKVRSDQVRSDQVKEKEKEKKKIPKEKEQRKRKTSILQPIDYRTLLNSSDVT
jgi:hypothetical protein